MTTIINSDDNELKELLIKNLPAKIKAGTDKHNSNIKEYPSNIAIQRYKFINFNSKDKISFMVFDIDEYENQTALEYFKTIDNFLDFIMDKIGLEPTFITQTTKGYHFAYHLKNWIFTNQSKPLKYLIAIKETITKILQADKNASHRLHGVWRNPLLHNYYYSNQINYELNDFKHLLPVRDFKPKSKRKVRKCKVNIKDIAIGNRNNTLFMASMRYAKDKQQLSQNEIYEFINNINKNLEQSLEDKEITAISKSVFIYWSTNEINDGFGIVENNSKNINDGAMAFSVMSGLTFSQYEAETKRRQILSAKRTVTIRDKQKNKEQLQKARQDYIAKKDTENEEKVLDAVKFFDDNGIKINTSRIAEYCELSWRTVKRYLDK